MTPKPEENKTPSGDKSNTPTQTGVNAQSTKPVVGGETAKPDPDHSKPVVDANGVKSDPNAPAPGDEGNPADLSAQEQTDLERILDGGDEADAPATTGNRTMIGESVNKLLKLLTSTKDAPDEHVTWGANGISLTLGDLRNIARVLD